LHIVGVSSETGVLQSEVDAVRFGVAQSAYVGKVGIFDPVVFKAVWEGFFVEMRVVTGTWNCADVDKQGYAVNLE